MSHPLELLDSMHRANVSQYVRTREEQCLGLRNLLTSALMPNIMGSACRMTLKTDRGYQSIPGVKLFTRLLDEAEDSGAFRDSPKWSAANSLSNAIVEAQIIITNAETDAQAAVRAQPL